MLLGWLDLYRDVMVMKIDGPYALMVPLTILCVAGAGVVLERTVTLPLRAVQSPYTWIVATLAGAIVIENIAALTYGTNAKTFPKAINGAKHFGNFVVDYHKLLVIGVAVGMMFLVELFLSRTMTGKAIRATADNPVGARLSGVPVPRLVTLSFALAGAIAGLAGVLTGPITFAAVAVGLQLGVYGFIAAVLGGLGSFRGALVGGLFLGLSQTIVQQRVASLGRALDDAHP